ncbi:hypothetical protein DCC77_02120 [Candidatus Uhrbacteria bacterium]|nr:MAG: hypothetical protein DCC77_02120 [Candidatus Uhrbacteria bacterium]
MSDFARAVESGCHVDVARRRGPHICRQVHTRRERVVPRKAGAIQGLRRSAGASRGSARSRRSACTTSVATGASGVSAGSGRSARTAAAGPAGARASARS